MGCDGVTSTFDLHVGIDYSGAATATTALGNIQVYAATGDEPRRVGPPTPRRTRWSRKAVADYLIGLANVDTTFIAGIDHAFGFPISYLDRYGLTDWRSFLADFMTRWPTHEDGVTVESRRDGNARSGTPSEFRLTEQWTASAKSVFRFDVQGQVAKSSHAGIPWLAHIREQVGDRVHWWPFDGWTIAPGKSAIVEVYPSLFRRRYAVEGRTVDKQDAYAVAGWLADADKRGILGRYLDPPLSDGERSQAEREGWILGVA